MEGWIGLLNVLFCQKKIVLQRVDAKGYFIKLCHYIKRGFKPQNRMTIVLELFKSQYW